MDTNDYHEFFGALEDDDALDAFLQFDAQRPRNSKGRLSKKLEAEEREFIKLQDDSTSGFRFTYKASRYEAGWLLDSMGGFYEQKWISDVLRLIKSGKEASVYLCKAGVAVETPFLAAKVYRPRQFRNLKNDSVYRVGRGELDENGRMITNAASIHAIQSRSTFGEKLRHQSWIAFEFQMLGELHRVGGDVPAPYAMGNNAILMDYIGDLEMAAPPLQSIDLEKAEASRLFSRTLQNIELLLAQDRIHGDLSAYNILYWAGEIVMIDFPQIISVEGNPAAWEIFIRDITRVCAYFASQGVNSDPKELAERLWKSYGHKIVRRVDPHFLDPEKPEDREVWERGK
jgi:RIO kinase 1